MSIIKHFEKYRKLHVGLILLVLAILFALGYTITAQKEVKKITEMPPQ